MTSSSPRVPDLPPNVPRRESTVLRAIGRGMFALLGWRVEGNFPDIPKMVVIVAPHTSNWDFVGGFFAYLALDLAATWFGKHTLFRWPYGLFFRHFGGIPILRGKSANVVDLYVDAYVSRDNMVLAIAPEGTRKKVRNWKSGFYRIATGAGVPIVPVAIDYGRKVLLIDAPFFPTGDFDVDLPAIKARYAGVTARHPELF